MAKLPSAKEALARGAALMPQTNIKGLRLVFGKKPKPASTPHNLTLILTSDERLSRCLRLNIQSNRPELSVDNLFGRRPERGGLWIPLTEDTAAILLMVINAAYETDFSWTHLSPIVRTIAQGRQEHPLQDRLNALQWDGKDRFKGFWQRVLGSDDTPLLTAYARVALCGLAARALHPGCPARHVPVLIGPQGAGKGYFLQALVWSESNWGSREETSLYIASGSIEGKDGDALFSMGAWLVEDEECNALRKLGAIGSKSFITRREDTYRPPFGRMNESFPRVALLFGSLNPGQEPFQDPTGYSRLCPVEVVRFDRPALLAERDQIHAQAVAVVRGADIGGDGLLPWFLTEEEKSLQADQWDGILSLDPMEQAIKAWIRGAAPGAEFPRESLLKELSSPPITSSLKRAGDFCRSRGCAQLGRIMRDGVRVNRWQTPLNNPGNPGNPGNEDENDG